MVLVKVLIMAAMLSSSVAMAAVSCKILGPDGNLYTGYGPNILAAKKDAWTQCGLAAIDDNFNNKGDMSEDTLALNLECVNRDQCQ